MPLIAVSLILGLSCELPALKGFNFTGGITSRGSLIALWFALSIYTGAFIAENVRAGIQAVSKGQTEAAARLGLRPGRIMSLVVLPQALRVIIPPLISNTLTSPRTPRWRLRWVHGCDGHVGRYHAEPDGPRHRMRDPV